MMARLDIVFLILDTCNIRNSQDIVLFGNNTNGDTSFYEACIGGHWDVVSLILDTCNISSSQDPLLTDHNHEGRTPFHEACNRGHRGVVLL